jgi:hypothetical protein
MTRTDEDLRAIYDKAMEKYDRHGPSAVYRYADALNIPQSACWQCEAYTPTLEFSDVHTCMLCGQTKTYATEQHSQEIT